MIAALSLGTAPISPTTISNPPYPQTITPTWSPMSNVDTLLGASTTLWPIIHRLSDLLAAQAELREAIEANNTSKASVLRTEFESTASAIELALTNWTAQIPASQNDFQCNIFEGGHGFDLGQTISSSSPELDPHLQSILANAEAYRQASLVYLYRYIHLQPTSSTLVQKHAKIALAACVQVVEWQGPMSALLWPLFISSCEAIDEGDRDLAKQAFTGVGTRQGFFNIRRAWDVVQEVWERGDTCEKGNEGEIPAKRICAERGYSIVFG